MQRISRQNAKNMGMTKYYTGEPCKRGHIVQRYIHTGACTQCQAEAIRRAKIARNTLLLSNMRKLEFTVDINLVKPITDMVEAFVLAHRLMEPEPMGLDTMYYDEQGNICSTNERLRREAEARSPAMQAYKAHMAAQPTFEEKLDRVKGR